MKKILVLGAGKIGSLTACLLANSGSYRVELADHLPGHARTLIDRLGLSTACGLTLDATDADALGSHLRKGAFEAVVSSLPYYCNARVAELARAAEVHYFDLTEDTEVSAHVHRISTGATRAFVPQCGLAPGFISIAANALMGRFSRVDTVKMRVGALPLNPNNALKYSLTWSTDGLINEYGNPCYGIENGKTTTLLPLEGYETITLDGVQYEAFNTSGGLGTLAQSWAGRVRTMNYKTLRYPGHCEKIRLLMNHLRLNDDRATLKKILENAVPKTLQDVVLIYAAVRGIREGDLFEENDVRKIYPQKIAGRQWSAIQVSTAAGLCAVLDLVLTQPGAYRGFVTQEQFPLADVLSNRFGRYYADRSTS